MKRKRSPSAPGGELSPAAVFPSELHIMKRSAFPAVRVTPAGLIRERRTIFRALRRAGVPSMHIDDAFAEVITHAWRAGNRGRYRPDPAAPSHLTLQRWLRTLAWRYGRMFMSRAHFAVEIVTEPAKLPLYQHHDPLPALVARGDLALLQRLKPERRAVLAAFAMGEGIPAIASAMGAPVGTTWTRLRQGRLDLQAALHRAAAQAR